MHSRSEKDVLKTLSLHTQAQILSSMSRNRPDLKDPSWMSKVKLHIVFGIITFGNPCLDEMKNEVYPKSSLQQNPFVQTSYNNDDHFMSAGISCNFSILKQMLFIMLSRDKCFAMALVMADNAFFSLQFFHLETVTRNQQILIQSQWNCKSVFTINEVNEICARHLITKRKNEAAQ